MAKNKKPPVAEEQRSTIPGGYMKGSIAPWPSIDRYPTIIGSSLTLSYISAVFRSAQIGYRREYVDVLDELLERDPHACAVLSQRIFGVAGGRLTMAPAKCDDSDTERAKEIANDCEQAIHGIANRRQSFAALLWGIFYGVSAAEINWGLLDGKWSPVSLSWIHSRRLAYPDPSNWDVRIWDQGMISGWGSDSFKREFAPGSSNYSFGLAPADFPGKFIVHAPQLRGDYPTRDGLGRELAYWMAIKLMAARGFAAFVERFGKPWPIGYYTTTKDGTNNPRAADDDDKKILEQTLLNIGAGNLNGAALPNSVKVELDGPTAGSLPTELPQAALIRVCNAEESKVVLGQSDTIEASSNGSRAATETRKAGTIELYRYDAACLCDTLKRDLVMVYVHLNYPGEEHLCPTPHIDVEPPPNRLEESQIILNMVTAGAPVDADYAEHITGIRLIPSLTNEPRRLGLCVPSSPVMFDSLLTPPAPPVIPGSEPNGDTETETPEVEKPTNKKTAKPGKTTMPATAEKKG